MKTVPFAPSDWASRSRAEGDARLVSPASLHFLILASPSPLAEG